MTKAYSVFDFNRDLSIGAHAWPGGYPRYFLMADGETLSFDAAIEEQAQIRNAIIEGYNNQWKVVACDINWEDTHMYCAHTGDLIACAYPCGEYDEESEDE